jgi:hypothetical protein
MDFSHLKYAGEAVFLLGAALRLLHWAFGAVAEGDAPPSAYVDSGAPAAPPPLTPLANGSVAPSAVNGPATPGSTAGPSIPPTSTVLTQVATELMTPVPSTSLLSTLGMLATKQRDPDAPPDAGDPALFPQSMLDAMTPDQRAKVVSTLVKQHGGGSSR